jgi:hypothetical protein
MARRTDFDLQVACGGTRLERIPAYTGDDRLLIIGMNTLSHRYPVLSRIAQIISSVKIYDIPPIEAIKPLSQKDIA